MHTNAHDFRWTPARRKAAELLAQDALSHDEIAVHLTINPSTLTRWKRHPDFVAKVEASAAALAEEIRKEGIANKQNRLDSYVADFTFSDSFLKESEFDPAVMKFRLDVRKQIAQELGQW